MIFVTVGGQGPFDRLVMAVDRWAALADEPGEIIAQIGTRGTKPVNCSSVELLSPSEFAEIASRADLIVSHAGMGTILTALDLGRPILIMPRRAEFGEHRNDHQLDTARQLHDDVGIPVAWEESELVQWLDNWSKIEGAGAPAKSTRNELLSRLREFVDDPAARPTLLKSLSMPQRRQRDRE